VSAVAVAPVLLDDGLAAPIELLELTGRPGPATLALLGGVHGDEPEGVLAVRRVVARLRELPFAGTVLAVPVASPSAWAAGTRTSPVDGGNLARCFPGDAAGSDTERVAHLLTERGIARATFLLDLHAAGAAYTMPLFAGAIAGDTTCGQAAAAGAAVFGAPLVWLHDRVNPGRSVTAAAALGVPAVYAETGGGGNLPGADLDVYADGVLRVMAHLGMLDPGDAGLGPAPAPPLRILGDGGDVDAGVAAPADGWCVQRARAGQVVAAGDPIAELLGDDGAVRAILRADRRGLVAMLRHRARVAAGEILYVLAPVPTP